MGHIQFTAKITTEGHVWLTAKEIPYNADPDLGLDHSMTLDDLLERLRLLKLDDFAPVVSETRNGLTPGDYDFVLPDSPEVRQTFHVSDAGEIIGS